MAKQSGQYEAMFLLGPSAATEVEGSINLCRQIIERHGGQVMVIKKWDERKLTYEIGGQKRGTYILAYFRGGGGAIVGMERDVQLSEEVLRVLITKADHLNEQEMSAVEPQPVQVREERQHSSWERAAMGEMDGRGRRDDRGDRGERGGRRQEESGEPSAAKE
jgi:small subunit ribosomal protein S6